MGKNISKIRSILFHLREINEPFAIFEINNLQIMKEHQMNINSNVYGFYSAYSTKSLRGIFIKYTVQMSVRVLNCFIFKSSTETPKNRGTTKAETA